MTTIALIGYGKMGMMLEKLAAEKGLTVKAVVDPHVKEQKTKQGVTIFRTIDEKSMKGIDVCIDFTHPSVIIQNITAMAELGKSMVIGTTGWYERMQEVERIVEKHDVGLIWSGNFSLGVNATFAILKYASRVFESLKEYDVMISEYHHNQKADAPSGTAAMMGEIILDRIERKTKIVTALDRKIAPEELHVSSVRGGSIPGIHTVTFDSPEDSIQITHTARNREGFASGALMAVSFIEDKRGVFTITDMMRDIIQTK